MVFTTHQNPDLDALASAVGLAWMIDPEAGMIVRFDSRPDQDVWHRPDHGCYIVDVGGGELDHHTRRADGSTGADRSTCAFTLCCEYMQRTGDMAQQKRARAMLDRVAAVVQRQDCTGSLTEPRDEGVNALGLGKMISRTVRAMQDDQSALRVFAPLLRELFAAEYVNWLAENDPAELLKYVKVYVAGCVAGYVWKTPQMLGGAIQNEAIRISLLRQYPDVVLTVYSVCYIDGRGDVLTHSRGAGAATGSGIDINSAIQSATPFLSDAMKNELASWHRESWWCGTGTVMFRKTEAPPADFVASLVYALANVLTSA